MKKLSALLLALMPVWCYAQPARKVNRYEAPVAAHYRQLGSLNRAPQPENAQLDSIRFPAERASAVSHAALKLPTIYVQEFGNELRLPPPPANSSAQTKAELDYLLRIQDVRKPNDIEQAKQMAEVYFIPMLSDSTHPHYKANISSLFFVGSQIGDWFTAQNLPVLTKLLQRVHQDASHTYYSLKYPPTLPD